ncbi:MAG: hypothetical protein COS34_04990 [Lysobacterales bacterium CG02_land_8_20_14_3_00_62_12]|nr:MAG: hypothetical protein COS34_04990 [Xanthomonadales bacterium CG02_land_8_20_14_3_00_62_12]
MSTMQRFAERAVLAIAGALAAHNASAITPESGFWVSPLLADTAASIEITDDFLFMAVYSYDSQGFATWYTAQGTMSDDRHFSGTLNRFGGGQPLTGALHDATFLGDFGPVSIVFDSNDETRATIQWVGRTMSLQRLDVFSFFVGTQNNAHQAERMLGEWTMVMDVQSNADFPFFGDVLIFDQSELDPNLPNQWFYDGCRPSTSLIGQCTVAALANHDASGFYNADTGDQTMVVLDSLGETPSQDIYFTYLVTAGLSQFDGVVQFHPPGGFDPNGIFFPVRGFRSASKRFVTTGSGPNALPAEPKSVPLAAPMSRLDQLRAANGGTLPSGLNAAEVQQRFPIDVAAAVDAQRQLEQRVRANQRR